MMFYKIIASKNNNRVTLVNQYNNIDEAKHDIGRQGYAILEISEMKEEIVLDNVYYFEIQTPEGIRKGKIKSTDLFKAYVKLTDDLGYQVLFIYDKQDADDNYKKETLAHLKKSYLIYREQNKKLFAEKKEKKPEESALAQKEVEKLKILYSKIAGKIETILNTYGKEIGGGLYSELEEILQKVRTLGGISNLDRLKLLGEEALRKIGQAELVIIEKNNISQKKEFLLETNKLLKGIGSHKSIAPEQQNIVDNLKKLLLPLFEKFAQKTQKIAQKTKEAAQNSPGGFIRSQENKTEVISKGSYQYYSILKDISVYKHKRMAAFKELFLSLASFHLALFQQKKLRFDLINQNIRLLQARLSSRAFSYTRVVHGFGYYGKTLLALLQNIFDLSVWAILLVSLYFIGLYVYASFFGVSLYIQPKFFYFFTFFIAGVIVVRKPIQATLSYVVSWIFLFLFLSFLWINF